MNVNWRESGNLVSYPGRLVTIRWRYTHVSLWSNHHGISSNSCLKYEIGSRCACSLLKFLGSRHRNLKSWSNGSVFNVMSYLNGVTVYNFTTSREKSSVGAAGLRAPSRQGPAPAPPSLPRTADVNPRHEFADRHLISRVHYHRWQPREGFNQTALHLDRIDLYIVTITGRVHQNNYISDRTFMLILKFLFWSCREPHLCFV